MNDRCHVKYIGVKKRVPTRYKSRAPKGYTGIDKATLPPPPPVDHKPSNASCLKQLDRRQKIR